MLPALHMLLQAKTHEKVDSIGEERSIGCHAVIMLIRKDLA
jgi:2-C-methyl-D-erythritol 2,4-cyclodiphosphate synthase